MAHAQPVKALGMVLEKIFSGPFQDPVNDNKDPTQKFAFLNAHAPDNSTDTYTQTHIDFLSRSICEQASRTHFLKLKNRGFNVHPVLPAAITQLDLCIIFTGKFRAFNESMVERAKSLTRPRGTILIVGEKKSGINSLRKRIKSQGITIDSLSKYHSLVFWFANQHPQNSKQAASVSSEFEQNHQKFRTGPGLFSSEKIDQGSAMLINYFDNISGHVADLGAGWGYLSWELCRKTNGVKGLDLYESEYHGIEASKNNLRQFGHRFPIQYYWTDICNEQINTRYDQIIMNPPFHQDLALRHDLGQQFIKKAAEILKPQGKLLMVANQHLAYEKLMSQHFSRSKILVSANGFKVISARK